MAKTTIVQLIDDLDGTEAHETVEFELDDKKYTIDLSRKHADQLRNVLARYLAAATPVGKAPKGKNVARARRGSKVDPVTIRAWALKNGFQVASRGRIRVEVVKAYQKAHAN